MLALELDARLQGGNLVFGYSLRRKPRGHSFQSLARDINLVRPVGLVIYEIHAETGYDLDDAFGLEPVDCAPERGSTHSELAAELFHADLVAGTVAVAAEEEGADKRIGVTAQTRPPQLLHGFLA